MCIQAPVRHTCVTIVATRIRGCTAPLLIDQRNTEDPPATRPRGKPCRFGANRQG